MFNGETWQTLDVWLESLMDSGVLMDGRERKCHPSHRDSKANYDVLDCSHKRLWYQWDLNNLLALGRTLKQLHHLVDFKKHIVAALHFSPANDNDNLFYLSVFYWHI